MSLQYREWDQWSTQVQIGAPTADVLEHAVALAQATMADVTLAASRFVPDTDVLRVNAAAGTWVPVSPTMVALMHEAIRVAELTTGLVTPLVGGALIGIGYDRDISEVGGAPVAVVPIVNSWREIEVAPDAVRIPRGAQIDLGASAKAWTADTIAARVHAKTHAPVLASIGGDIAVGGTLHGGFLVEVAERAVPREGDAPSQQLHIHDGGLATSTTVVRRWHSATSSMHHILDPRTALPAQGRFRTVSVAAASCADANAASTASIIMGDAALGWLASAALPARLVSGDGEVSTVAGWPDEPA